MCAAIEPSWLESLSCSDAKRHLRILRSLGSGAFANVYLAQLKDPAGIKHQVALKVLHPYLERSAKSTSNEAMFLAEASIMMRLKCSSIIRALGVCRLPPDMPGLKEGHTAPALAMVLEYMEEGSLARLVLRKMTDPMARVYTDYEAYQLLLDVARGLHYMHSQSPPLVHRDMKQENVLLTRSRGRLQAKIADLGLYTELDRCARTALLRRKFNSQQSSSDSPAAGPAPGAPAGGRPKLFYTMSDVQRALDVSHSLTGTRSRVQSLARALGVDLSPLGVMEGCREEEQAVAACSPEVQIRLASAAAHQGVAPAAGSGMQAGSAAHQVQAILKTRHDSLSPLAVGTPVTYGAPDSQDAGWSGPATATPPASAYVLNQFSAHAPTTPAAPAAVTCVCGHTWAMPQSDGGAAEQQLRSGASEAVGSAQGRAARAQQATEEQLPSVFSHKRAFRGAGRSAAGAGAFRFGSEEDDVHSDTSALATRDIDLKPSDSAKGGGTEGWQGTDDALNSTRSGLQQTQSTATPAQPLSPIRAANPHHVKCPSCGTHIPMYGRASTLTAGASNGALVDMPKNSNGSGCSAAGPRPPLLRGSRSLRSMPNTLRLTASMGVSEAGALPRPAAARGRSKTGGGRGAFARHAPDSADALSVIDASSSVASQTAGSTASRLPSHSLAPPSPDVTGLRDHIAKLSKAKLSRIGLPSVLSMRKSGALVSGERPSSFQQQSSVGRPASGLSAEAAAVRAALSPEFQWVFNLTAETGSCMYMAPEVYRHEPYNCMADVYSFGILAYEVATRTMLVFTHVGAHGRVADSPEAYAAAAAQGYRPERPERINPDFWDLVSSCWAQDPLARPTMEVVVGRLEDMLQHCVPEADSNFGCSACSIC